MKYNFDVSEKEAEEIFHNKLFPSICRNVSLGESKKAYIVGGQPGSGKSSFAQSLLHENENLVFINGDDLRVFHPHYVEYLRDKDQEAADRSQMVCNYWIEKAIDSCIEKGLGFIVEGTMRRAEAPLTTATKAKGLGYEVKGCVIATPYELSLASINYRYTEAKRVEGYARYTKKESHDEAFNNIPDTLERLISENVFSELIIYKRLDGGFESCRVPAGDKEQILELIQEGRERPLTERELSFVRENSNPDGHPFPII